MVTRRCHLGRTAAGEQAHHLEPTPGELIATGARPARRDEAAPAREPGEGLEEDGGAASLRLAPWARFTLEAQQRELGHPGLADRHATRAPEMKPFSALPDSPTEKT